MVKMLLIFQCCFTRTENHNNLTTLFVLGNFSYQEEILRRQREKVRHTCMSKKHVYDSFFYLMKLGFEDLIFDLRRFDNII